MVKSFLTLAKDWKSTFQKKIYETQHSGRFWWLIGPLHLVVIKANMTADLDSLLMTIKYGICRMASCQREDIPGLSETMYSAHVLQHSCSLSKQTNAVSLLTMLVVQNSCKRSPYSHPGVKINRKLIIAFVNTSRTVYVCVYLKESESFVNHNHILHADGLKGLVDKIHVTSNPARGNYLYRLPKYWSVSGILNLNQAEKIVQKKKLLCAEKMKIKTYLHWRHFWSGYMYHSTQTGESGSNSCPYQVSRWTAVHTS